MLFWQGIRDIGIRVALFVAIVSSMIWNTMITFHVMEWKKVLQFIMSRIAAWLSITSDTSSVGCPVETYRAKFALDYGCAVSRCVNDPDFATFYYKDENIEGMIPYRAYGGTVVAIGDPVCKYEHTLEFVERFYQFCHAKHWQCVFAPATQQFADLFANNSKVATVLFGEECIFNPMMKNRFSGRQNRGIKSKYNQAKKNGVVVNELTCTTSQVAVELSAVRQTWVDTRKGLQAYLCAMELYADPLGKRWFYATNIKGKAISVLVLVRMNKYHGYVIKNLFTVPDAPKGTSEFLVMETMEKLAQEGCSYVTFGPCVSERLFSIFSHLDCATAQLMTLIGICKDKGFFNAGSSMQFRKKYVPQDIEPSYMIFYNQNSINLYNLLALFNVFHLLSGDMDQSAQHKSSTTIDDVGSMA